MRIKTFQGRSLEEVLPQIRQELGAGAVVLGQRQKVQGGVAGFFGTRMLEVTAADRMPSDEQLIDLEDQLAGDDDAGGAFGDDTPSAGGGGRGTMRMGRRGGIDVTDAWDPAADAELAAEYGRVLEHAAAAGFSELEVPVAAATRAPADPAAQAQALAARTHLNVQAAAQRAEAALSDEMGSAATQSYAPPAPLPSDTPVQERARTFAASVLDGAPAPTPPPLRHDAQEALRGDLGFRPGEMPANDELSDAISAAIEMIDLRAAAALRNTVDAARRIEPGPEGSTTAELVSLVARLEQTGVDREVAEAVMDIVRRHRVPFAAGEPVEQLAREVVGELLDVRSGFPTTGRAHRLGLVGTSSSGKTCVAAKLAMRYREAGLDVGVIVIASSDPSTPIVNDPRLVRLDVDVRYVTNPSQAATAAQDFDHLDLVIVDTPGSTYLDDREQTHVAACFRAIGMDDVHVVVPISTNSREAESVLHAFHPLGANRLLVSRVDESRYIGQLLNFGFRLGVPMTYLSEGPRIPEDLRVASAREFAERILPSAGSGAHTAEESTTP